MTDIKFRRPGLRLKIAQFSDNPEAVLALYKEQDARLEQDYLEAKEVATASKEAFFSGMVGMLERTIQLGRSGMWGAKYSTTKSNAELYADAPYLFDRFSKKVFDGAVSLAECREWLADEGLDESLTGVYQMYAACFRNIIHCKWDDAEQYLVALLAEIKSEITEE